MKKLTAFILVLVCLLCLSGCLRREETVIFQGRTIPKAQLSQETLQWLERYNALSPEEQLAISYIPSDLYALCGYGSGTEMPAETR